MWTDQQWSTLASIAQVIQAVVVIVGVPVVVLQVRSLRAENKHRQWEALHWALGLLQSDVETAALIFRERLDLQPGAYSTPDEVAREVVVHLSSGLTAVQLAVDDKYVDRQLLFTSIGASLARLHQLVVAMPGDDQPSGRLAAAIINFPGMRLLEAARAWHDASAPGPSPTMSQVAVFGDNRR